MNYITPIRPEDFAQAAKGSKIKDVRGGLWTFLEEPQPNTIPASPIKRLVKNCNGDDEYLFYVLFYGPNNIVDSEDGILIELNVPGVTLVP